jgi:hypothetical protein
VKNEISIISLSLNLGIIFVWGNVSLVLSILEVNAFLGLAIRERKR